MNHSKVLVGAIAGAIVTVAGANLPSTPVTATEAEGGALGQFVLSEAARERVLNEAGLQLAAVKKPRPKPFGQENGPVFAQWRGQVKAHVDETAPGPSGDVLLAFVQSRGQVA